MIALIFVIAAVLAFEIVVIAQSKKAHYIAWKREFERELSPDVADEIQIRELYDTTMSPKEAVEYFKELTNETQTNKYI